jgi:hypothetical protein
LNNNHQGNLLLRYDPLEWLTLSSQAVFTKHSRDSESEPDEFADTYSDQQRTLVNLFATAHHAIVPSLSFNTTIGLQVSGQKFESEGFANNISTGSINRENNNEALITGLGLEYNDYLFANVSYRADKNSAYPDDNNTFHNYSYGASFVFSEALHIDSKWFSGKLRGTWGDADLYEQNFPEPWFQISSTNAPGPSSKKISEAGLDLGFLNNRLVLTTTYFEDTYNATYVAAGIGSGYQSYIDIGKLKLSGWEIMLNATSVQRSDFVMTTKLAWTKSKSEIQSIDDTDVNSSLTQTAPDWYGTILNQISWKNFFTTFLINVQEGGSYLLLDGTTFPPTYYLQDASEIRLKDISFGYRFAPGFLSRLHMRNAQVSLSGRNLWLIHAENEQQTEGSYYSAQRKSANLSLTLTF